MSEGEEWLLLADLRWRDHYETLKAIADAVRAGCNDPKFLRLLADHIDPTARTPFGTKFAVRRVVGAGAPRGKPNLDLQWFLERQIDFFGEKAEAVFAEAKSRFGVSRSTCASVLKMVRARRQKDPELAAMFRDAAALFREAGDPDFQPLSSKQSGN